MHSTHAIRRVQNVQVIDEALSLLMTEGLSAGFDVLDTVNAQISEALPHLAPDRQ
jgi:hypothetical protein